MYVKNRIHSGWREVSEQNVCEKPNTFGHREESSQIVVKTYQKNRAPKASTAVMLSRTPILTFSDRLYFFRRSPQTIIYYI